MTEALQAAVSEQAAAWQSLTEPRPAAEASTMVNVIELDPRPIGADDRQALAAWLRESATRRTA